MDWYKVSEIKPKKFIKITKPIWDALEKENIVKKREEQDVFLKSILPNDQYKKIEKYRQIEKIISMKLGSLHEDVSSLLPHCKKTKQNSMCDIIRSVRNKTQECYEIKNRHNTLNANSAKTVAHNLKELLSTNKKVYLVQINCPTNFNNQKKKPKHAMPPAVKILNGKEYYQKISGRNKESFFFFDDLLETIHYIFQNFDNFSELKTYTCVNS
jgi:hypothetical protein